MVNYVVEFHSKRVKKELESFPKQERRAIEELLEGVAGNPKPLEYGFGHVNRTYKIDPEQWFKRVEKHPGGEHVD